MNRRIFLSTLGIAALAATATLAHKQTTPRISRIVTTKDSAYLIGKIEPVLTGEISEVALASQGRYALIVQDVRPEPTEQVRQPFGEQKLWLYDALRRTTKLVHRVQDEPENGTHKSILQLSWFPGTKRALIVSVGERTLPDGKADVKSQFGIYDVDRAAVRWLSGFPATLITPQQINGLSGFLLTGALEGGSKTRLMAVLQADGNLSPVVKLETSGFASVRGLSLDKTKLFLRVVTMEKQPERQALLQREKWVALEIGQGLVTPLAQAPPKEEMIARSSEPSEPKRALALANDAAKLTGAAGRSATTNALWLEASEPRGDKKFARGLVTAEAESNYLLPDLSAVLYTHDGALYAAPLAFLDRLAFEKLLKQLAMTNAKQVGIGLMMYAQDYDENFPNDPSRVRDAVMPYIRSSDVFAEFVYTYSGPTGLGQIAAPSTTTLGYISGPGGRAVIFADGHVKWEPTPGK
jgi:hypothetical protein